MQRNPALNTNTEYSAPASRQPYERPKSLTFILAGGFTTNQLSSEADTEFTVGLILWLERVNDPSAGSPTEQVFQLLESAAGPAMSQE